MNHDSVWQLIRYVMLIAGGAATTAGYLSNEEITAIIGAAGTLFTTAWGLWVKWGTSPVRDGVIIRNAIPAVDSATGAATRITS